MVARPGGGAGGSAAGQARAVARPGERATRARFGQAGDFLPVRSGNFGRNEMSGSAWTGDSKPNPNHSSNTPVRSAGAGTDWADGADGAALVGPARSGPSGSGRPALAVRWLLPAPPRGAGGAQSWGGSGPTWILLQTA
jgi:hypothetical protein